MPGPQSSQKLRIKLVKSPIGYTERQKATVRALGLRRLQQVVERPDNEAVRGMIFKIQHLLQVEPAGQTQAEGQPARSRPRSAPAAAPSPPAAALSPVVDQASAAVAPEPELTPVEAASAEEVPSEPVTAEEAPPARPRRKRTTHETA